MNVSPPQVLLTSSPGWFYAITSQLPKWLFWKLSLGMCLSQEDLAARHCYLQWPPLHSLSTLRAVPFLTSGVPTTAIRVFTPRKNSHWVKRNQNSNSASPIFNTFPFSILDETEMNTDKKPDDLWEEFDCSVGSSSPAEIASLGPVFSWSWSQGSSVSSHPLYIRFTQWQLTSWQVADFIVAAIKSGVF